MPIGWRSTAEQYASMVVLLERRPDASSTSGTVREPVVSTPMCETLVSVLILRTMFTEVMRR
jgi:hypothetical protein